MTVASLPCRARGYWVLTLLLASASVGCGGGVGAVNGKVTYRGKPIAFGSVLMVGSDNVPRHASLQADGAYTFVDIPAGEFRVAVNSPDPRKMYAPQPPASRFPKKEGQLPAAPPPQIYVRKWFPIPAKAGDPETSGVKITVRGGPNSVDIDLQND